MSKSLKFGKAAHETEDMPMKAEPMARYAAAFTPLPGSTPVSLADNRGCKWPVGEDPFLFCGLMTETGRYCPTHEQMSGIRLPAVKV